MYDATVTIFNYYESNSAAVWYPHVLSGVHLETDRGQIIKKYGPESTDNAELHIAYTEKTARKSSRTPQGKSLSGSHRKPGRNRLMTIWRTVSHSTRQRISSGRAHGTGTALSMALITSISGARVFWRICGRCRTLCS